MRALAFFAEWEGTASLLAVLAANTLVDAGRALLSPGGPAWVGGPAAVAGGLAAAAGLGALVKAEADTVGTLRRRAGPSAAAGLAVGAAVAAALITTGGRLTTLVPDIGLAAGAADISAAIARVNPELTAAVPPAALAGVVAVGVAAAAALLPPAAGRAVRSGELACRPPDWGRAMLQAGLGGRVAVSAALAAPLLTALLWFPATAGVWGLDGDALALAQAASLILQGALLAVAARPLVAGHLGTALTVWYTRKHGLMDEGPLVSTTPNPPPGGDPAAAASASTAAAAAAGARAGELARLASRVVLYFTGKAALQVAAPAALLSGCGVLALHGVLSPPGTPGAAASRAVGLGVGGAAALVWAACTAWHLLLFRIGFLTDVPAARVGVAS